MARLINSGDSGSWKPGVGDVVLFQLLLTLGYAVAVIIALHAPDSRLAGWVGRWVDGTRPLLRPFYALAGHPTCGGAAADPDVMRLWDSYIHLMAISLVVAGLCFMASAALWTDWAARLNARLSASRLRRGKMRWTLQEGWGRLGWAALAVLWFLILDAGLFDSADHCAQLDPWLFLRIPLLAAATQGFASAAAMFWTARGLRGGRRD